MDTTNIDSLAHYVGIDISKQRLDCWLRPAGAHLKVSSDGEGFDEITEWLHAQGGSPEGTVMCTEHAGSYGKRLVIALSSAGWDRTVEKTTITDKVGPEHHRKNDRYDPSLIAQYADRYTD